MRGLRYDQNDYFWINDLTPVMIMHPTNPKLDGQNLSTIRDPDGFALFNEMVAIAKAKGAGMVDYRWPKPGASAPVEKNLLRETVRALGLGDRFGRVHR
ncbi:cache domain-containing protein [Pseudomonas lini]